MSDSIDKNVPPVADVKPVDDQKDDYVPKKAYEETKADLFKFKQRAKELEAKTNQLAADAEARDKQILKDNEQWKALYEKTNGELETVKSTLTKREQQMISVHKKNAILKEVGGFKKDEYANFINVDAVEMDESGTINAESLASEVNRIKQNYAELLKGSAAPNLPNGAPKSFNNDKEYKNMSLADREKLKMKLILDQQKKK